MREIVCRLSQLTQPYHATRQCTRLHHDVPRWISHRVEIIAPRHCNYHTSNSRIESYSWLSIIVGYSTQLSSERQIGMRSTWALIAIQHPLFSRCERRLNEPLWHPVISILWSSIRELARSLRFYPRLPLAASIYLLLEQRRLFNLRLPGS